MPSNILRLIVTIQPKHGICGNKCTDKCKTLREKSWGDNLADKVHENPSLEPQCPFKNLSAGAGAYKDCPWVGSLEDLGTCWQASLADLVNARLSEKPCFKKLRWKMIKRNCWPLASMCMYVAHTSVHMWICTHTYTTHTNAYTFVQCMCAQTQQRGACLCMLAEMWGAVDWKMMFLISFTVRIPMM